MKWFQRTKNISVHLSVGFSCKTCHVVRAFTVRAFTNTMSLPRQTFLHFSFLAGGNGICVMVLACVCFMYVCGTLLVNKISCMYMFLIDVDKACVYSGGQRSFEAKCEDFFNSISQGWNLE